jgi:hypothetical protein
LKFKAKVEPAFFQKNECKIKMGPNGVVESKNQLFSGSGG